MTTKAFAVTALALLLAVASAQESAPEVGQTLLQEALVAATENLTDKVPPHSMPCLRCPV